MSFNKLSYLTMTGVMIIANGRTKKKMFDFSVKMLSRVNKQIFNKVR